MPYYPSGRKTITNCHIYNPLSFSRRNKKKIEEALVDKMRYIVQKWRKFRLGNEKWPSKERGMEKGEINVLFSLPFSQTGLVRVNPIL